MLGAKDHGWTLVLGVALFAGCRSYSDVSVRQVEGNATQDGRALQAGDRLVWDKDVRIGQGLLIADVPSLGELRMLSNSAILLPRKAARTVLKAGTLWLIANKLKAPSRHEIHTGNAVIVVRGTEFFVGYEKDKTDVRVVAGEVAVVNRRGEQQRVPARTQSQVVGSKPPTEPKPYDVRQDLQWADRLRRLGQDAQEAMQQGLEAAREKSKDLAEDLGNALEKGGKQAKEKLDQLFE